MRERRPRGIGGAAGRTSRIALAAFTVTVGLASLAAPSASATVCASATGIPCVRDFAGQTSWGFDDRVRTMLRVGDVVYVGGRFTKAESINPDGSVAKVVERDHLAALDVKTGALLSWAPRIVETGGENGDIYSLVSYVDPPSGATWVLAAGDFTGVATTTDGTHYSNANRHHLAAFRADKFGSLTGFAPDVSHRPRTMVVSGSTLFIGGSFSKVDAKPRGGLAAVTLPTGALTTWAPQAAGGVNQLAMLANGNIAIAGEFTSVSDGALTTTTPYLAVVTQGGSLAWTAASQPPSAKGLCVTANGNTIFLGEGLTGNAVAAYNGTTGAMLWHKSTNGDVQAIGFAGNEVIAGGHFGRFYGQYGNLVKIKKLAALDPLTGIVDAAWRPAPTPITSLGVWGITGTGPDNPDKLFIGGDFTGLKRYPTWRFGQYAVP